MTRIIATTDDTNTFDNKLRWKNFLNEEDLIFYESNKRYFYFIVNKLNEKYKFELLDYSEIYNSKPQLFYDYEHLNESGRQEFTKILNDLLK